MPAIAVWSFQPSRFKSSRLRKALDRASVPALIVLGVGLRWWSPAMKSDFWYDEAYCYAVAARPFRSMIDILYRGADTNPPLYTVLLHFWIKLGHSDSHVKLLSLLFGTVSIPLFYMLSKRIAGRRGALVSCLLFAVSQPVITYAVEVRPYALLLCLSLVSTYFLLAALEQQSQRRSGFLADPWLGYAAASVLAIYTHWFALLLLFVQSSALVVYQSQSRRHIRSYLLYLSAIVLCCLPLGPFLWNQVSLQNAVGGYSWPGKPGWHSLVDLAVFLAGGRNLLVVIAVAFILYYRARKRSLEMPVDVGKHASFFTVYLVLPVAVVFVISNLLSNNSFFVYRYFLPFIISCHLLVGFCLSRISRWAMLILVLGFGSVPVIKTYKHWRFPEAPYSQLASQLPSNSDDGILVGHFSPMSYYPVRHYRAGSGPREGILWLAQESCYEVSYNLRAGMLDYDELVEIGPELGKYTDLWVILDPIDRDKKLTSAYQNVRMDSNFILESEKRVGELRLEHYRSKAYSGGGAVFNPQKD